MGVILKIDYTKNHTNGFLHPYQIYFFDGEIVAETNSTWIVHTFTLGAHVLAADSFDGFLRSGNASGNYLVAEVGLPLENSVNVVAMMLLLLLIVGLFMASVGGKK